MWKVLCFVVNGKIYELIFEFFSVQHKVVKWYNIYE